MRVKKSRALGTQDYKHKFTLATLGNRKVSPFQIIGEGGHQAHVNNMDNVSVPCKMESCI